MQSVPVAFLKWKTLTKIKEKDYTEYALRTQKMGKMIEIYLEGQRQFTHNAFQFWRLQVQINMPFYKKGSTGEVIAKVTTHANNNGLIKRRVHGNRKVATPLDILIKLSNLRDLLDARFKRSKRDFFWTLKMYQDLEKMILGSNQSLLLRTMRLNERNYYDNVRKSREQHISPHKFM